MSTGTEKPAPDQTGSRPLLDVAAAQTRLLAVFEPLPEETLPLEQCAGRVLASAVRAPFDIPLFANSSMDGFAVRSMEVSGASAAHPVVLRVAADIPAGQAPEAAILPGQAARIMTGAPLPVGSDAVVPVEDTDFNQRQPELQAPAQVEIFRPAAEGDNVRPVGQDVQEGETVLQSGTHLRPQEIGLLAMLGQARVQVHRRPKVAVLSTGDELVPVGQALQPGKIYDSNSYTLIALIEKYGGEPVNLGIVPDQFEAVQASLELAVASGADLILSSAGVSVGAFDFVRSVVERHGHLSFWRVNMRPGKPLAFGAYQNIPFIGLPGNPVSSFVGFEVFVRPAILKLTGVNEWRHPIQPAELQEAVLSDGRESYLRGRVEYRAGRWLASLTGHQGSGNLRSLAQANALLLIPSGVKSLPAGARIDAWFLDHL